MPRPNHTFLRTSTGSNSKQSLGSPFFELPPIWQRGDPASSSQVPFLFPRSPLGTTLFDSLEPAGLFFLVFKRRFSICICSMLSRSRVTKFPLSSRTCPIFLDLCPGNVHKCSPFPCEEQAPEVIIEIMWTQALKTEIVLVFWGMWQPYHRPV